jgi:hypothetical protein
MIKGKLYERINEIEHFETGYSKLYTYSVIDMLNEAKKDFPKQPQGIIDGMPRIRRISKPKTKDYEQWFNKYFGE